MQSKQFLAEYSFQYVDDFQMRLQYSIWKSVEMTASIDNKCPILKVNLFDAFGNSKTVVIFEVSEPRVCSIPDAGNLEDLYLIVPRDFDKPFSFRWHGKVFGAIDNDSFKKFKAAICEVG